MFNQYLNIILHIARKVEWFYSKNLRRLIRMFSFNSVYQTPALSGLQLQVNRTLSSTQYTFFITFFNILKLFKLIIN